MFFIFIFVKDLTNFRILTQVGTLITSPDAINRLLFNSKFNHSESRNLIWLKHTEIIIYGELLFDFVNLCTVLW